TAASPLPPRLFRLVAAPQHVGACHKLGAYVSSGCRDTDLNGAHPSVSRASSRPPDVTRPQRGDTLRMRLSQLACGASAAVIALAAASAVFAQETTGGVRGQIVDDSGAP